MQEELFNHKCITGYKALILLNVYHLSHDQLLYITFLYEGKLQCTTFVDGFLYSSIYFHHLVVGS